MIREHNFDKIINMNRDLLHATVRVQLFFFLVQNTSAQGFLNGDFENNAGSCILNIPNNQLNSDLADADGYGIGNEIDLMDSVCGYGAAYTGNYFCASLIQPEPIPMLVHFHYAFL